MKSARGIPLGPTNHIIIPQQPFFDENQMANLESFRQESVSFQLERFPELGVRISDALGDEPILVGGNDMVFDKDVYKEIKLRILWPGYSRFPFERRLKTRDTKASRSLVLMLLSRAIADFIKHVNHNRIPVEQGFERWEVGMHRPSITSKDLFVTGLIHRGGSNWQPEIWCPSNRAN
ncbi:hypothetical protein E1B28_011138 [Marasmius oreades]|uniref:Uncharacterized protein n=1 Tax=Marasmius oreades TaxID=181124 RepID=A0A9P7RU37_9AGAR|nr:uncharacterized protein E1B28_011138 [Marasmius oreades]KAG7089453.1 hypothetical protein E1B28_011138 [Marasmius oreades]